MMRLCNEQTKVTYTYFPEKFSVAIGYFNSILGPATYLLILRLLRLDLQFKICVIIMYQFTTKANK